MMANRFLVSEGDPPDVFPEGEIHSVSLHLKKEVDDWVHCYAGENPGA
jgi:hypothetical protein